MTVDELLARSKEIDDWVDRNTNGLKIEDTDRVRVAGACFDQVHEHGRAIRLLIEHRLMGPAFALVRVTFESLVRGLWLRDWATDEDIATFEKEDKLPKSLPKMIKEIETKEPYNVGLLSRTYDAYFSAMCSYAHTGYLQARRRNTSEGIAPNYTDGAVKEVIRSAATMVLWAAQEIIEVAAGGDDLKEAVMARMKSLDPTFEAAPPTL